MNALRWLAAHDHDYAALRRAGRTAIVMPSMFAIGDKVIQNAELATFAAFGSFAMLLLVDFGGRLRDRVQAQAGLVVAGGVFVCLGTLASRAVWLGAVAMAVVGFCVLFAGVVSSVLAGATTSLLLAFILPVSLPGSVSELGPRLAGWTMAGAVSIVAIVVLWPAPSRDPLRAAARAACAVLADRLRAEITYLLGDRANGLAADHERAAVRADEAIASLQRTFLATPYRPTGLSTPTRTLVRLVDELSWLSAIVNQAVEPAPGLPVNRAACAVKASAAEVLECGADLLAEVGGDPASLQQSLAELDRSLTAMEGEASLELPVRRRPDAAGSERSDTELAEFITSLDPGFRAQELSYAASIVGRNIELTAAAERRSWLDRLLGRQPRGISGAFAAAGERASAHLEWHSVWLHNSVRGAAGLGLAVLVANLTGVQHSFWVVLGTLSVLRSNALNTGSNALRGLLGTVVGFVVGAGLLEVIGTNPALLWAVLPIAILVAGVAPAAISFAAGQAGFTVTLVILFNIVQPAGWRIGLLRIEDIAIGCAVSLAVGMLFWPRGAAAVLRRSLAEAYEQCGRYLASAVQYGIARCDAAGTPDADPVNSAARAAAASRRLDDAFRVFLAERGAKPLPLAEVTALVTGVTGLRLAADAVLELWQHDGGEPTGDRAAARAELQQSSEAVQAWYDDLAGSLTRTRGLRPPLDHDLASDARLVAAVRHDLRGDDGRATATAVRMIWTADHLDVARRLQESIAGPAQSAALLRPSRFISQVAQLGVSVAARRQTDAARHAVEDVERPRV